MNSSVMILMGGMGVDDELVNRTMRRYRTDY
jgi:hypothetical protein